MAQQRLPTFPSNRGFTLLITVMFGALGIALAFAAYASTLGLAQRAAVNGFSVEQSRARAISCAVIGASYAIEDPFLAIASPRFEKDANCTIKSLTFLDATTRVIETSGSYLFSTSTYRAKIHIAWPNLSVDGFTRL